MELTTQDVSDSQGGLHSVQIEVAGETKTAVDAIPYIYRNEATIIPISLSDLDFNKPCIRVTDIDRITLVASSYNGIDISNIEFFATFYRSKRDFGVDLNDKEEYKVVPVF